MDGYVYILQNQKNNRFYIGSTVSIERRFTEHNSGQVTATKYLIPWELKFFQKYSSIAEARQVEYKLKRLKKREVIENIIERQEIIMSI